MSSGHRFRRYVEYGALTSQIKLSRKSHSSGGAAVDPEVLLVRRPTNLDTTRKLAHVDPEIAVGMGFTDANIESIAWKSDSPLPSLENQKVLEALSSVVSNFSAECLAIA